MRAELRAFRAAHADTHGRAYLFQAYAGTRALFDFLAREGKALDELAPEDFVRFRDGLAESKQAQSLLKGVRLFLRYKVRQGVLDEAAFYVLIHRKGKEKGASAAQQGPFYQEGKSFAASLTYAAKKSYYRLGAVALLQYLSQRELTLGEITREVWDAFRQQTLERGTRGEVSVDAARMRVCGARAYLGFKAEQGLLGPDQVFPAPRGRHHREVNLPPALAMLLPRLQEAMDAVGLSSTAKSTYRRTWTTFLEYLTQEGTLALGEVTRDMMTGFRLTMQQRVTLRGACPALSTQMGELAALRFFFSWQVKTGMLLADPTIHLPYPRLPRLLPRPLKVHQVERLIDSQPATTLGRRDRALLELLYGTGMRRGEAAKLTLQDLDFDHGTILVREGKGRKDRMLPLGRKAREAVMEYLHQARERLQRKPSDMLFLGIYGGALKPDSITQRVTELGRRLGIKLSAHVLRHSCATHLLRGRADIRQIQRLLGHESLQTTEKYTKVEVQDLRAVLRRCHPREKK